MFSHSATFIPPKKSLFGAYFQQGVLIDLLDSGEGIKS
jgi:hypothetical protein